MLGCKQIILQIIFKISYKIEKYHKTKAIKLWSSSLYVEQLGKMKFTKVVFQNENNKIILLKHYFREKEGN
jgi:hypothetical protein